MKFKPKTKEKTRKDVVITINTLLEVTEHPKGTFLNQEKLYLISIKSHNTTYSTNFPHNKNGTKDLLKFIKRECQLT